jgi:hypothetical protein
LSGLSQFSSLAKDFQAHVGYAALALLYKNPDFAFDILSHVGFPLLGVARIKTVGIAPQASTQNPVVPVFRRNTG